MAVIRQKCRVSFPRLTLGACVKTLLKVRVIFMQRYKNYSFLKLYCTDRQTDRLDKMDRAAFGIFLSAGNCKQAVNFPEIPKQGKHEPAVKRDFKLKPARLFYFILFIDGFWVPKISLGAAECGFAAVEMMLEV